MRDAVFKRKNITRKFIFGGILHFYYTLYKWSHFLRNFGTASKKISFFKYKFNLQKKYIFQKCVISHSVKSLLINFKCVHIHMEPW